MRIGKAAAKASAEKYGTVYTPGNVVDLLCRMIYISLKFSQWLKVRNSLIDVASGETFDWVKGIHNTNLTYIYELRDTGRSEFFS